MTKLANIWSSWSRKKRFIILLVSAFLVSAVGAHTYFRFHLDGVYDDLQMACDCNWVFKDGQIYMVTVKDRAHVGTYTREGGRWVCRPLKGLGGEFYMESSLLGVWWPDSQARGGGKFLPRRCFSPCAAMLYDWYIRL
jgi:hypothetical protein